MRSSRVAWGLTVSLAVGGWLAAHCVAYLTAAPSAHERMHALAGSGHGYLRFMPYLLGLALGLALACFVASAVSGARGRSPRAPSFGRFGLVPPLAFVVQEHVERLLHAGAFPLDLVFRPVFAVGLLLQIPFALAAIALARFLFSLGVAVGRRLTRTRRRPRTAAAPVAAPHERLWLPSLALAGAGNGQRAPPGR